VDGVEGPDGAQLAPPSPSRLRGAAAVKAHCTLGVGLALCAVAFWFEIGRALGGNALSWAYVFEWPLLGVFGVYMWWNVLHPGRRQRPPRRTAPAIAPEYNAMLAAWQDHQRELEATQRVADAPRGIGTDSKGAE